VWADADFTRLAQVFSNLLNNAAKYTERGGRIHLTVTTDERTATITVTDTGVGIPSALLPRIFDMFRQLQEFRDRTHGGLGIGLTLAKRLVELHGGTIDAHSDGPGRGSSFVVRVPAAKPAAATPSRPERELAASHAGCRVLVAEDNPDAAEMMRI